MDAGVDAGDEVRSCDVETKGELRGWGGEWECPRIEWFSEGGLPPDTGWVREWAKVACVSEGGLPPGKVPRSSSSFIDSVTIRDRKSDLLSKILGSVFADDEGDGAERKCARWGLELGICCCCGCCKEEFLLELEGPVGSLMDKCEKFIGGSTIAA